MNQENVLLRVENVKKEFPGVKALDGVEFSLKAGEIHALMGENGAGKSTLIKVITGVYQRDAGSMILGDKEVCPESVLEAESYGISTVFQEVNLIRTLSVAENILLGRQPKKYGCLNWKEINAHARKALARLGIYDLDVTKELSHCSMAVQQMVAIARALDIDAKILILDEPTSSLDEKEVEALFEVMRNLRDQGLGIVFVTHFLGQVYQVCDRITVLRNGGYVGDYDIKDLPKLKLISKMLGKDIEDLESIELKGRHREPLTTEEFLIAEDLGRIGAVDPLDLSIKKGEIVGLAGLLGSGRTETARLLFGADSRTSGSTRINNREYRLGSPMDAIRRGIGFCSEDRKGEGIIPNLSVRENIILALQAKRGLLRKIKRSEQITIAEHYISALKIKTPSAEAAIKNLSGGNQQKVLLARWLAVQPELIILDEPTRGIDVGAKAEIEKLINKLSDDGVAVLFISSELEEVVRVCDRISVLRDRKKIGELVGDEIDEQKIMQVIASEVGEERKSV